MALCLLLFLSVTTSSKPTTMRSPLCGPKSKQQRREVREWGRVDRIHKAYGTKPKGEKTHRHKTLKSCNPIQWSPYCTTPYETRYIGPSSIPSPQHIHNHTTTYPRWLAVRRKTRETLGWTLLGYPTRINPGTARIDRRRRCLPRLLLIRMPSMYEKHLANIQNHRRHRRQTAAAATNVPLYTDFLTIHDSVLNERLMNPLLVPFLSNCRLPHHPPAQTHLLFKIGKEVSTFRIFSQSNCNRERERALGINVSAEWPKSKWMESYMAHHHADRPFDFAASAFTSAHYIESG